MKINFAKKYFYRKKSERMQVILRRVSIVVLIGICAQSYFGPKYNPDDKANLTKKYIFIDWLSERYITFSSVSNILQFRIFRS